MRPERWLPLMLYILNELAVDHGVQIQVQLGEGNPQWPGGRGQSWTHQSR